MSNPPSTAPTSPISPTSPTSANGLIDCKMGTGPDNQNPEWNEKSAIRPTDSTNHQPQSKVAIYWQKITSTKDSPRSTLKHRQEDGRPILLQRIDDHPEGYPQLTAFINSDDNFLIARKYGFLRSRLLLYRQDELSVLEKGLLALDNDDNENRKLALQSRKHDEETDDDPEDSRKALMRKIDDKLKEYDELVSRIQTYVSLKAPSTRNVTSFMTWFRNHKPLVHSESDFIKHQDDFVALSGERESGWLDGIVEDTLTWILPRKIMGMIFTSSRQLQMTDHHNLHLYSKRRIDIVVRLVLVLITVGLLVGPSAVLYFVTGQSALKICLIMIFTLLFAVALSVCTKAKRHEMLAATATYAAVLVVFLGNFNPSTLTG